MMIVPAYCDIQKAEDIAEKRGRKGDQCAQIRPVRRLQLEHHDRDNDGDHTVAECFQPAFVQRLRSRRTGRDTGSSSTGTASKPSAPERAALDRPQTDRSNTP